MQVLKNLNFLIELNLSHNPINDISVIKKIKNLKKIKYKLY